MQAAEVVQAIASGEFDGDIGVISEAIADRKKSLKGLAAAQVGAELVAGDRVRLQDDAPLRPKYILSVELEVEKVNQTTATVKVVNEGDLPPNSKWRFGFRAPLAYLEKI